LHEISSKYFVSQSALDRQCFSSDKRVTGKWNGANEPSSSGRCSLEPFALSDHSTFVTEPCVSIFVGRVFY
jgi:hypothetical protein